MPPGRVQNDPLARKWLAAPKRTGGLFPLCDDLPVHPRATSAPGNLVRMCSPGVQNDALARERVPCLRRVHPRVTSALGNLVRRPPWGIGNASSSGRNGEGRPVSAGVPALETTPGVTPQRFRAQ